MITNATTHVPLEKQFSLDAVKKIEETIFRAKKIAIISHRSPDGDTIGSGLGLREILLRKGKYVKNICVDSIPTSFLYLPEASCFERSFVFDSFDLFITVDTAAKHQTGIEELYPKIFSGDVPLINIDHHISNEMFGTVSLVDAMASSTTVLLWKMFRTLGWEVSSNMATCLLNGLMTDTGSFQHSSTSPESLRIAAKMLSAGADLGGIRKNVFRTTPVSTLKLWGEILNRVDINSENIVVSVVREIDFEKTGANQKDISGAIDYLNMVPEAEYSLLLTERDGKVKGSLRTQQDAVNVSDIAGNFGGGGHVRAAGFTVSGRLHMERRFTIISEQKAKVQEVLNA
jgi:phosphoesterase RecJ-like protein